jgi:tetraacyldisaccharide 4'-kinase
MFLLSLLYAPVTMLRNLLYDLGVLRSFRLPAPVISVGNITAGGTGKTPLVIHIGRLLGAAGVRFGVLSRGYRRKSVRPFAVESARGLTAAEIGDEPKMIGEKLGCALGIAADRARVGRILLRKFGNMPLLLDDGFSHRRIRRDLDILVIDADDPFGGGMLPYGKRRETLRCVRRAQAAVITASAPGDDHGGIRKKLYRLGFRGPVFTAVREIEGLVAPDGSLHATETQRHIPFHLFSGIANGPRFVETAGQAGLTIADSVTYPDHFLFDKAEMEKIRANAGRSPLLTTEKDFWRVRDIDPDIYYIRIALRLEPAEEFRKLIFETISPA